MRAKEVKQDNAKGRKRVNGSAVIGISTRHEANPSKRKLASVEEQAGRSKEDAILIDD